MSRDKIEDAVIDIGGSSGGFISSLLHQFPALRGGIFDRPEVTDHANTNFHGSTCIYRDLGDRVSTEDLHKGGFFKSIPSYEIYTMKLSRFYRMFAKPSSPVRVRASSCWRFFFGKVDLGICPVWRTCLFSWLEFNERAAERAAEVHPGAPIASMYEAVRNGPITKTELFNTLDEALFTNLDVTVELRAELQDIRCGDQEAFKGYISTTSNLLTGCILESARLKPMAPFPLAQAAPTDRILGNFVIPARANFVLDTVSLNILNPYWGKDNLLYRPWRFLQGWSQTQLRYRY
ncbi:hypothetical protein BBP40_003124 [Aspergillus hancockii]|nr:hypothetical protein BBP40_003124 [Aspergillus hancockii]